MAFDISRFIGEYFSKALQENLILLRRDLHAHPELAFEEERTAETLSKALSELGLSDVCRIAGTGVSARIPGKQSSGKIVALRGDIDALPIQEKTGLPYASCVEGKMHACGHDVHATWTVGAAALLAQNPAEGDVIIVLQPAEERGEGAMEVLKSGVLDDVKTIFGGHVDRRFDVGQIVADEGAMGASTDSFQIRVKGRAAHGARPQESADPIVGSAAIITALQSIVSRRLNPALPGVVTIGTINGGCAQNIIPDEVTMAGTLRATTIEARQLLKDELRRICDATAHAYGLEAEVHISSGTPAVVNHPEPRQWAVQSATKILGSDSVVPMGTQNMGGEDFAHYLEKIPGCFMRIGAREPGGKAIAAHSSEFYAAEEALFVGAVLMAEIARTASRGLNSSSE